MTHEIQYPMKDDAYYYTETGDRALSASVPCKSSFVLNRHNCLFDKYTVHSASFLALTIFAMFSSVGSLTHTKVPLVCKSIQASCIVAAHVDATFVLVGKTVLILQLMLLFFTWIIKKRIVWATYCKNNNKQRYRLNFLPQCPYT